MWSYWRSKDSILVGISYAWLLLTPHKSVRRIKLAGLNRYAVGGGAAVASA